MFTAKKRLKKSDVLPVRFSVYHGIIFDLEIF